MDSSTVFNLEVEVESADEANLDQLSTESGFVYGNQESGQVQIRLLSREIGHGFGFSEVITIAISVGAGASSDLVADAIRSGVKGIIRQCKTGSRTSDGSRAEISRLIDEADRETYKNDDQ